MRRLPEKYELLAWRGVMPGLLVLRTKFDAEDVALRVAHDRMPGEPLDHGRANGLQPDDLVRHGDRRAQVEMHPVLGSSRRLRYSDKPHVRATPARRLHVSAVGGRVLVG